MRFARAARNCRLERVAAPPPLPPLALVRRCATRCATALPPHLDALLVRGAAALPPQPADAGALFGAADGVVYPRTVAVGLSGGVDSAVSALLLRAAGWRVLGVFMRNWDGADEAGTGVCPGSEDLESARATAAQLGVPLHVADFSRQYWNHVFEPFLEAYAGGFTPNPDVLCNRHIKFGAFRAWAAQALGAPFVATGHYAQLAPAVPWWQGPTAAATVAASPLLPAEHCSAARGCHGGSSLPPPPAAPRLLSALDPVKDQSDFLSLVPGVALARVIFPVGGLHKAQVREVARRAGLTPAGRRDSYGICFIGKRSLPDFLREYLPLTPGAFVDIVSGRAIGWHTGAEAWTVGQKARVGGLADKYYVVGRAAATTNAGAAAAAATVTAPPAGTVWVAPGRDHPSLFFDSFVLAYAGFAWVDGAPPPALAAQAAAAAAAAAGAVADDHASPPLPPPAGVAMRYRIRHRQEAMGAAGVSVMTRAQYEAGERAAATAALATMQQSASIRGDNDDNGNTAAATAAMAAWRLHAPPRNGSGVTTAAGALGANTSGGDPDELLLVVRVSAAQRAATPGQVLVLYESADGEPDDGEAVEATTVSASAAEAPPSALGAQPPWLAALGDGDREVAAPPLTRWRFASRRCYGGGAILGAGPSYWQRGLPTPAAWRE